MEAPKNKVLCVEDHADVCELITFFLRSYEVVSAPSGRKAIEKLGQESFSLIILDYHLPDRSGEDICLQIRSSDKDTPIVFFTADENYSTERALSIGAQAIVRKSGPDFLLRLEKAVDEHVRPV